VDSGGAEAEQEATEESVQGQRKTGSPKGERRRKMKVAGHGGGGGK